MVTRPARIHSSTLRREPSPAVASSFCSLVMRGPPYVVGDSQRLPHTGSKAHGPSSIEARVGIITAGPEQIARRCLWPQLQRGKNSTMIYDKILGTIGKSPIG